MQLYNIICNTYAVRVADGETKFRLETTTAKGCNSLSEVKQEMRNRYENYGLTGLPKRGIKTHRKRM